jgi:hypothetical protein
MFAMTQKGTKYFLSKIATLEKKIGGGKILTRIAIHILVKKRNFLSVPKTVISPHCAPPTLTPNFSVF